MELQSYKCPICGVSTTNAEHCEYCGSLLVRFEAKGVWVSDLSSYTDDRTILPGLLPELKRNLQLQKEHGGAMTKISLPAGGHADGSREYTVLQSSRCAWMDHVRAFPNASSEGLAIRLGFCQCNEAEDEQAQVFKAERDSYVKFRSLEFFEIFTHRVVMSPDGGRYVDEYMIDFGSDAAGAAHLVSDVIRALNDGADFSQIRYMTMPL